jgi:hypothetical protein
MISRFGKKAVSGFTAAEIASILLCKGTRILPKSKGKKMPSN